MGPPATCPQIATKPLSHNLYMEYGPINMPNLMKTTIEISDARLNAPKERATAQGTHGRIENRRA